MKHRSKWSSRMVRFAMIFLRCPPVWYALLLFGTVRAQVPPPVDVASSIQVFGTVSGKDGFAAAPLSSALSASLDKQQAEIRSMHAAKDEALLFAVMVDISTSESPSESALKDATVQLFRGLTTGENRGYLVLINQTYMPSKRPLQPFEAQAALSGIRFQGGTALYDGIAQACSQTLSISRNPGENRRVLVILSDGDDNYSHTTFSKAEEACQREGVAIFSLTKFSTSHEGEVLLRQATRDTGGREILVNSLPEGIAPLLAAIEEQWAFTIVPTRKSDQQLHSLSVKTTQKDLTITVPSRVFLP